MLIEEFNTTDRREAVALLRPCLDIERWIDDLVDHRPYQDIEGLVTHAEQAASPFEESEVAQAISHHPRIGDRPAGAHTEARLSRAEQGAIGSVDAEVAAAIQAGNVAYEEAFGQVFLIRAAGRTAGEILSSLTERLSGSPEDEARIVARELREIAVLRLRGLFS